jgi:predicted acylesterase/phospholipase RssA
MIPPKRIVLSGGGIKVTTLVGALLVLEDKGVLKKVKEVSGVSAGAFLGFLMAIGVPLRKIETLVLDLDFGVIRNITPEAFLEFPERYGIDDGVSFVKFLESIMRVVLKIDPVITFAELTKLNRPGQLIFRCWATDLNTHTIREFSETLTPTVKIIDALRASMALPFYFTPSIDPITGHMLTDGGVQGNLPLHHLRDDECEESLSLAFSRGTPLPEGGVIPQDLMGFVNSLFSSLVHSRNEDCLKKWRHKIIYIPAKEYPSWNFEASREDRIMLMKIGSDSASKWLNKSSCGSRKCIRRYSI